MTSQFQTEWIDLTAEDGHRLKAYVARPAQSRGTLVVVQEIFGVNSHIRSVVERFAAAGYTAIAPALFDRIEPGIEMGYSQEDIQRGIALKGQVSYENALKDVASALAWAGAPKTAAVTGFCWGGSVAWLAAARLPVKAAVPYYGGNIKEYLDAAPQAPVLAHFGERDHGIPLEVPRTIEQRYPTVVTHLYPADHGFNCDVRGSYDADSAARAWKRTLGFLDSVF